MLVLSRSQARRFRQLVRKSLAGRPRGPSPPVWVMTHDGDTLLLTVLEEVVVTLKHSDAATIPTPLLLPMALLDAVEGAGDDSVSVIGPKDRITANWIDRGLPRTQCFDVPEERSRCALPVQPTMLMSVPPGFLSALHEAGRSMARQPMRYALQRIQIRGKAGEVIGTDAQFVYRHEGFALPFSDDLLVPAVPLFGLSELANAQDVRVGRTDRHLVIAADAVTVYLQIDANGHYPDVASVIPTNPAPITVTFDPEEALFLLDALPTLPGQDDEDQPVTIDLTVGSVGVVRARSLSNKAIVEVQLPRSRVTSGSKSKPKSASLRIALDRRYLRRMLTLGCRTFRVFAEHRPLIALGDSLTTLVMPVGSDGIVPPSPRARVLTPTSHPRPLRSSPMKSPEPPTNTTSDGEGGDPLVEAEALRNALGEAQNRLGRMLTALRSKKKEQKALNQVWSSLKNLNLGG